MFGSDGLAGSSSGRKDLFLFLSCISSWYKYIVSLLPNPFIDKITGMLNLGVKTGVASLRVVHEQYVSRSHYPYRSLEILSCLGKKMLNVSR